MSNWIQQLKDLVALKEAGALTEAEFQAEKSIIMAGRSDPSMHSNPPEETSVDSENKTQSSPFSGNTIVDKPTGFAIGDYRLLNLIGQGGMGEVYRARNKFAEEAEAQGDVAIKLMLSQYAKNKGFRDRFILEANLGQKVDHPGIARVHEVISEADQLALVMELIEGEELAARIPAKGMFIGAAVAYIRLLAEAIDHIHQQGIIHRDLKPKNIKLRLDGSPVILDFGVAKEKDSQSKHTKTNTALGTIGYMAPEQMDAKNVGPEADQFALAMIAYEMLSGEFPWESGKETEFSAYRLKYQGQLIPLHVKKASIPKSVSDAVGKALSPKPEDRYPTCVAFAVALEKALSADPDATDVFHIATNASHAQHSPPQNAPTDNSKPPVESTWFVKNATDNDSPNEEVETTGGSRLKATLLIGVSLLMAIGATLYFSPILDRDRDGVFMWNDCDDRDKSKLTPERDKDCDGTPTERDCDDNNPNSTIRSKDADCDQILSANDCNDLDPTLPSEDDMDCDLVTNDVDCDDENKEIGTSLNDADCDQVKKEDDCDDHDKHSTTKENDADCDGITTANDCNDLDPKSTIYANDVDCDGIITTLDCDDSDPKNTSPFAKNAACPGESCLSILDNQRSDGDGYYFITGQSTTPFEVYCDMSTAGGGWMYTGVMGDPRILPYMDKFVGKTTKPFKGKDTMKQNWLHPNYADMKGKDIRIGSMIAQGTNLGSIFELNDCTSGDPGCWYGAYLDLRGAGANDGDMFGSWILIGGDWNAVPEGCSSDQCPALSGDRDHSQAFRVAIFGGDCNSNCKAKGIVQRRGFKFPVYGEVDNPYRMGNRAYWSNATKSGGDNSLSITSNNTSWGQSGKAFRNIWIR